MKRSRWPVRTIKERLMSHVTPEPNTGCWLWTGADDGHGYGAFRLDGKTTKAYRIAFMEFRGVIPKDHELDHLCRVRACVNPAHLEPVPHIENVHRSPLFLGHRTHCKNGHPYTPDNINASPSYPGRQCKTCCRESIRRHRERKALAAQP